MFVCQIKYQMVNQGLIFGRWKTFSWHVPFQCYGMRQGNYLYFTRLVVVLRLYDLVDVVGRDPLVSVNMRRKFEWIFMVSRMHICYRNII